MTAKIKLNAASGGGSFSLQAPSSSANNRVITLPDVADGTLVTSQSTLDATKLSGNLPAISGASLTNLPAGGASAGNMFRAKMNGGYNTTNNTQGEIIFQSEDFDLGGAYNHTNGRFTPNIAGYYFIDASLQFSNSQSNYHFRSSIYKNGSEWSLDTMWNDGSNGENHCKVSSIVYVNGSSDYISIFGWQNSGGALTVNPGNGSYFSAFFLRTS